MDKRLIDCAVEAAGYTDGLIAANEKAWRADWQRDFRNGIYTPYPEYLMIRLDETVMADCMYWSVRR